jgi:hypothetical protein
MKKLLWVLILIFCVPFLCGFLFDSKPKKEIHVIETTETGDVVIDVGAKIAKTKMKFDIFRTIASTDVNDPNKIIIGNIEVLVARIMITKTAPAYSVGTIIGRLDGSGSKPKISDISIGMLCRKTTKETLKAEKKIYKYQKKALKRQYKLTII